MTPDEDVTTGHGASGGPDAIFADHSLVALALGAFRPFSQVFDLTSWPIVQGWVA